MSEAREMAETVVHILRPGTKSAAWGVYDPYLCGLPNRPRPGIDDNWVYSNEGCATCPECIRVFHADDNPDRGADPELLAERAHLADPALLALARFGATVIRECIGRVEPLTMDDVLALGWKSGICEGSAGRMVVPGVHDAIAALLAPDGAASEGVPG